MGRTEAECQSSIVEASAVQEGVLPVLEWEGLPTVSFKGKRDWHYKHERLPDEPGSAALRSHSPKQMALRRIVQVAPNYSSPSPSRRQRSASRECCPAEMAPETITVRASDFQKYGTDVNQLRNCQVDNAQTQKIGTVEPEGYLENPWAGKTKLLHDLLMRECNDDAGINQKWFPPPTATGRYETPSPGPKRRYYGSETSTRLPSPSTASPARNESRPRSRAPSRGKHQDQLLENSPQKCKYAASPNLPPRSPLDSCRRRRAPHQADSNGRQPSLETQTIRLPPRLPQRTSTPKHRELF
eukprot:gnl/MRDRNA2_/MRDRNA2_120172_c0_seq1.p1 gnl/MRDRNA2_/MRDRNA2_120172_c0~~gnl/MRDRNA2_/MRDRNA2_120172_c0_seq1.p1  ORF type:complete len:299 (+),score=45.83 gnl/MRDRNA2_/MRDRNA2_120172_c0_seq1:89-985(+)